VAIFTKDSLNDIEFFVLYFAADWQITADRLLGRSKKDFAM
jgi:hypothetical protein